MGTALGRSGSLPRHFHSAATLYEPVPSSYYVPPRTRPVPESRTNLGIRIRMIRSASGAPIGMRRISEEFPEPDSTFEVHSRHSFRSQRRRSQSMTNLVSLPKKLLKENESLGGSMDCIPPSILKKRDREQIATTGPGPLLIKRIRFEETRFLSLATKSTPCLITVQTAADRYLGQRLLRAGSVPEISRIQKEELVSKRERDAKIEAKREVDAFLERHQYTFRSAPVTCTHCVLNTSDDFFHCVNFMYTRIEARRRPRPMNFRTGKGVNRREMEIQETLRISKKLGLGDTVKRSYLLNPIAPFHRQFSLKFLHMLAVYVNKNIGAG